MDPVGEWPFAVSQTFGERIAAMEEKLEILAGMLGTLLQVMGLTDENGEWVNDEPAAGQGD